jgi:hypothetical protein
MAMSGAQLGSNLDYVLMGANVWAQFASLTAAEVPWWLQAQGHADLKDGAATLANLKAVYLPDLPPNTILGGDKRALRRWESPKYRVQVNEIQDRIGWVNVALFAYNAFLVTDSRALLRTDLDPAGAGFAVNVNLVNQPLQVHEVGTAAGDAAGDGVVEQTIIETE